MVYPVSKSETFFLSYLEELYNTGFTWLGCYGRTVLRRSVFRLSLCQVCCNQVFYKNTASFLLPSQKKYHQKKYFRFNGTSSNQNRSVISEKNLMFYHGKTRSLSSDTNNRSSSDIRKRAGNSGMVLCKTSCGYTLFFYKSLINVAICFLLSTSSGSVIDDFHFFDPSER